MLPFLMDSKTIAQQEGEEKVATTPPPRPPKPDITKQTPVDWAKKEQINDIGRNVRGIR
jgi:hypothetical protein